MLDPQLREAGFRPNAQRHRKPGPDNIVRQKQVNSQDSRSMHRSGVFSPFWRRTSFANDIKSGSSSSTDRTYRKTEIHLYRNPQSCTLGTTPPNYCLYVRNVVHNRLDIHYAPLCCICQTVTVTPGIRCRYSIVLCIDLRSWRLPLCLPDIRIGDMWHHEKRRAKRLLFVFVP